MRKLLLIFCSLIIINNASAAPPDVQKEYKVDQGQLLRIVVKGDKIGSLKSFGDDQAFFDELAPQPGVKRYVFQATKSGTYVIGFWTVGEDTGTSCTITVGTIQPAPVPPGPSPVPNPGPVTSFHVFIIYDDAATYTAAQTAILYSTKVADYLDSSAGTKGWRRFPKNTVTTNDDPIINTLWTAVKPKLTVTPCIVIEVNTKAEILPLPESPDALIELLKKYKGQ